METSTTVTMNVSTFNIRGLTNKFKQNFLPEDNASFKLDFCLLQETKCTELHTITKNSHTITLKNSDKFYGLGICYNSKIFQLTKITEYGKRVCFYQLTSKSNDKEKIDIINVYAPTNILTSSKPEGLEEFYINLKSYIKNLKSNIWFIGGDFNSKIRKNKSSTQGGHKKSCQNNNGLILEEFIQENNLFASNSLQKAIKGENHLGGSSERQNNLQCNRFHLYSPKTEKVPQRQ